MQQFLTLATEKVMHLTKKKRKKEQLVKHQEQVMDSS